MSPLSRNAIIGYLAATFVAGAVAGVFGARAFPAKPAPRPPRETGAMSERILKRWTTDFHLSPEQVTKIEPILRVTDTEVSGIHQENERRMKGAFERMHQQVLPLLDEDQKRLLEEHRKKMERRGNERRHGGAGNSTNSGTGKTTP
ncbi:MAG: hypothetical protein NTX70_02650 [Verrucomicrobia bacterium]|jgi:hypothetical protein|nr:hypothetical protein [Verrucomicrobiota bacterium]